MSVGRHRVSVGRVAKLLRVAVSVAFLLLLTALMTVVTARVALALDCVARIQVFPLALGGAAAALMVWFGLTLLFGRFYCSSVCPMGTLLDVFSHLRRGGWRKGRVKHPFHFSQPLNRFRYVFLGGVAASVALGVAVVPSLFDPYSAYGRICTELWLPLWQTICGKEIFVASWLAFVIALITLVAIGVAAYRRGRLICNTVCPVGSTLGIFSRYSLFHFDIDTDLCVNCRKCENVCMAECIDMADHVVDGSRCVACFNCVGVCENNAMRYTWRRKKLALPLMQRVGSAAAAPMVEGDAGCKTLKDDAKCSNGNNGRSPVGIDRRKFLATGLVVAITPAIDAIARSTERESEEKYGGGRLKKLKPVAPPGRHSMADFMERCTGCGLCVAHCPSKVLRPSVKQYGWLNMLHPVLDYGRAYCLYDCTNCTEICPTGALMPLTKEEKHIFIIGHASVEADTCIGCGRCAAKCPRRAVAMVARGQSPVRNGASVAMVDTTLCIGCGACESVCPVNPVKAIRVDGIV